MARKLISGDESFRLKKMAQLARGSKILDIGCSSMPNPYLKAEVLVGFDLNDGQLTGNYDKLIIGDVYQLPNGLNNETFDVIVIGEVLEHINDPILFLKCCSSVLKDGGSLVLSTPNPHSFIEIILNMFLNKTYFYDPEHTMLYPQRWLIRILELSGFSNVKLYSGGMIFPFLSRGNFPYFGLIPFPRSFCYQTIAVAIKN